MAETFSNVDYKQTVVNCGNLVVKAEVEVDLADWDVNDGDTIQAMKLPKGAIIHQAGAVIKEVDGNAITLTLKVGATALTGALTMTSAVNTAVHKTDAVLSAGSLLVTAEDTLDLLAGAADSDGNGRVQVYCVYSMLNSLYNADI